MFLVSKTSINNPLPSLETAITQITDMINAGFHAEVGMRLLKEALYRSHSDIENMMHALHDYFLGYYLCCKKIHQTYINFKIFMPYPVILCKMEDMQQTGKFTTEPSTCVCGGIHCPETTYDYVIASTGIRCLDARSFPESSYVHLGFLHAANGPKCCVHAAYSHSSVHAAYSCCRMDEDEDYGPYDYFDEESSDSSDDDPIEINTDDSDFVKDDRGEHNYHAHHIKREYHAKCNKKNIKKRSLFKKRGARNPRPHSRQETRHSKTRTRRIRLGATSDDEFDDVETLPIYTNPVRREKNDVFFTVCAASKDQLEIVKFPRYNSRENASLEDASPEDASPEGASSECDSPEKDTRYHRKKHSYMREKHIRDQEKKGRELGIPVARKMKRRDIPTSRYNRHKELFDREEL